MSIMDASESLPDSPEPASPEPDSPGPASPGPESPVLFYENGASWHWLWLGVAGGLAMVFVQYGAGLGFRATVPLFFFVMMCSVLALQVRAARLHTSVELTAQTLRQGTETLPIGQILLVYPEAEHSVKSGEQIEPWQEARTLGELNGVPKGRTGIGLKLANDRTAQAWARDDEALRAALTKLVES
jgi:hypothetical protein